MITAERFTSADLELMPEDGKRYELIAGELFVSRQPSAEHQYACTALSHYLFAWNLQHHLGVVLVTPGLIFAGDDDVAPDLIWISREKYAKALDQAGHLHTAPELVIEVLSPGKANERRDRKAKLNLYSRRGVQEYWIVDWIAQQVEVYRRRRARLAHLATWFAQDQLESPLLPGFSCTVAELFTPLPCRKPATMHNGSFTPASLAQSLPLQERKCAH